MEVDGEGQAWRSSGVCWNTSAMLAIELGRKGGSPLTVNTPRQRCSMTSWPSSDQVFPGSGAVIETRRRKATVERGKG
jgi:hypothetical protein